MHRAENITTFMCRLSGVFGRLNLLETSGPVQACNGIALLLFIYEADYGSTPYTSQ